MSGWNLGLNDFSTRWLEVMDQFEAGRHELRIYCIDVKAAQTLRFEWYAFKRRMKEHMKTMPADAQIYPSLNGIRAEIGQVSNGRIVLRLILRELSESSQLIAEALARPETDDEEDFTRIRTKL